FIYSFIHSHHPTSTIHSLQIPPSPTSMSTTSSQQTRRVARRACLSCRERKIKCDGEPMTTITAADGSNKIIPERTRTCSNCRFLDIPCVFVQSNRGGKRKKRDPEQVDLESSPDHPFLNKKLRSLSSNSIHDQQPPASPSGPPQNGDDISSSTQRVSSFILDGKTPNKLPSPVFSQTTVDPYRYNQFPRPLTSVSTSSGPPPPPPPGFSQRPNFNGGGPPPPPPHDYSPNLQRQLPGQSSNSLPPPPPPPPGPPPPPPGPPHLQQYYGYPPSGPPPPQGPPPPGFHHHNGPPGPPPPPPFQHHPMHHGPPGYGFGPPPPGPPGPPGPPPRHMHRGPPGSDFSPPSHHHRRNQHHHHRGDSSGSGSGPHFKSHGWKKHKYHTREYDDRSNNRPPLSPSPPSNMSRSTSSSSNNEHT
ncbi:putative fungal zinc cluster transcription factor, partial [Candida maltosa Xu316]